MIIFQDDFDGEFNIDNEDNISGNVDEVLMLIMTRIFMLYCWWF
jgi:hypothetical protein